MSHPTYSELIQLLSEAERDQSDLQSVAELLAGRFCDLCPHIKISRPGRFLETVRRIAGPIRSGRLKGDSRKSYLERHWIPRTRNIASQGMCNSNRALFRIICPALVFILWLKILVDPTPFPEELNGKYGLTVDVLNSAFGKSDTLHQWSLRGIPDVGFYRKLHQFLKKWPVTRTLSKTAIGKFYLVIDGRLQERRSSPYNTYKFVEQLVSSNVPDSVPMSYGLDKQLGSLQAEVKDLNTKVQEQQAEISLLKQKFESFRELKKYN